MALKLTILVGTMTGTAQLVAQELELVWDDGEMRVETLLMDKLDAIRTLGNPPWPGEQGITCLPVTR